MAKPPKKSKPEEIETEPDGWDRFTKAVKRMAPPKPRKSDKSGDGSGGQPRPGTTQRDKAR